MKVSNLQRAKTKDVSRLKIAIDGPAGTGKSTIASIVAERLGIPSLNSGQLYRSVAYLMLRAGEDLDNPDRATAIAQTMDATIENGIVTKLGSTDVTGQLHATSLSVATPRVAKHLGVRQVIAGIQKDYAAIHGAVMEGRAIGTVVMPDADFKIYLTCDPSERVRRRLEDGNPETLEELLARDRQDMERNVAPLKKPEDAVEVDTTNLTIEEVVTIIVRLATSEH